MAATRGRLILAILATLLGFWLISQLTVATWLAREAAAREQAWGGGGTPWRWDFSDAGSVVSIPDRPGAAGFDPSGMELTLPASGAINLSLALRDDWIDLRHVERARIGLASDHAVSLVLLSTQPHHEWLRHALGAGRHRVSLPFGDTDAAPINALILRLEAPAGTRVALRSLILLPRPCGKGRVCAEPPVSAPPFLLPEQLLLHRDLQRQEMPATSVVSGGHAGTAGAMLARSLPRMPDRLLAGFADFLAMLALIGLILRRRQPEYAASARALRPIMEVTLTLGLAWILLLAGWPARDTPILPALVLGLSGLALVALPAPATRPWHWVGDVAAWRGALRFTLIALVLSLPLVLLRDDTMRLQDPGALLRYPAWALLQQWLLMVAITPRMQAALPDPRASALAAGIVFALLHTPNFGLMLFTLAGGTAWAWLGQRDRALLPLVLSHALLGLWLVHIAPAWLLRSAEIGGRYLMVP